MKAIITLLLIMTCPVFASGLQLSSVKQVLYLYGAETDCVMKIVDVPFASGYSDPEWFFAAISEPFVPPTDGSWKEPSDVNLASLYGISVRGTYTNKKDSNDVEVTIDLTKAKVPEGYPFTLEQVTEQVKKCAELMYPYDPKIDSKLEIKVLKAKN